MISYSAAAWPGPVVWELASRLEGGEGVGLTLNVAIFVYFAHFFSV